MMDGLRVEAEVMGNISTVAAAIALFVPPAAIVAAPISAFTGVVGTSADCAVGNFNCASFTYLLFGVLSKRVPAGVKRWLFNATSLFGDLAVGAAGGAGV